MAHDQKFFLALAAKGKDKWNAWRRDPANKDERVTFAGVDFSEWPKNKIDFSGFQFGDDANFSGCRWRGAPLTGDEGFPPGRACFSYAAFGEDASFTGAVFGDTALFTRATFGNGADFGSATFGLWASFTVAAFGENASFHRRDLRWQCHVQRRGLRWLGRLRRRGLRWLGRRLGLGTTPGRLQPSPI